MNPLVVLANDKEILTGDTARPKDRPHECFSCLATYDRLVADKKIKEFPCSCKLATDIQMGELRKESTDLTEEEKIFLEYAVDPVAWAEFELGWVARWYQEEILRCSSVKKAIRAGRRVGKTASLGVDVLHKVGTNSNFRALIVAPYQDQVDLIFDQIDKHIENSMTLKQMLTRRAKHPSQRVEFSNGSVIMGSTAGVKTGARANKVRGQDAHAIYIDEIDMLAQEDLESILAILASHKDCSLWASGTPSGKREHFYRWCTDKGHGFKEFHYTSSVSPSWTEAIENWFRGIYSQTSFAQEFLAEFGEEAQGVFAKNLVDESLQNYELNSREPRPDYIYGLGVDWNDTTHGVHIILNSWNPFDGKFWVERKWVVSKMEFTQTRAIEKIIEINSYWNPSFIYVDAGYGNTQIELLRAYGKKNPQSGLIRKVKGIQMGSKVEMRDPIYGLVQKEVKPFIVNLSVRRLEQGDIVLPRSEYKGEGTEGLVDQMMRFRIKRFSPDGRPVYDQTPDHSLTAWMLSIYGFWMEHTEIGARRSHTSKVGIISGDGAKKEDAPPFGFIKIEVPAERVKEKKDQEKSKYMPRARNVQIGHKTNSLADLQTMRDEKKRINKDLNRDGPMGFYRYLSRPTPKRKMF